MPRPLIAVPLALLAAGCLALEEPAPTPAACPVIESRDWTGFVNAMPGPDARPELIVTGTVTLPSAGYSVDLRAGPADRSARPAQTVNLVTAAPRGPAATVLSDREVRLSIPAIAGQPGAPTPYRGVRVLCEGEELAFIAPIETAW